MISACFRVFYRKNTWISFWASWNFTCMEIQVCRYLTAFFFLFFLFLHFQVWSASVVLCVLSLTCTYAHAFKFWISRDHTLSWWCPNNSISFSFYFLKYLNLLESHFGKLQSKDMLQHLWTGPISNAAVDVVQGDRSVEVRSVGVTKVYTQQD